MRKPHICMRKPLFFVSNNVCSFVCFLVCFVLFFNSQGTDWPSCLVIYLFPDTPVGVCLRSINFCSLSKCVLRSWKHQGNLTWMSTTSSLGVEWWVYNISLRLWCHMKQALFHSSSLAASITMVAQKHDCDAKLSFYVKHAHKSMRVRYGQNSSAISFTTRLLLFNVFLHDWHFLDLVLFSIMLLLYEHKKLYIHIKIVPGCLCETPPDEE